MEIIARRWMLIGTAVCALLAIIGWLVATYAFKATPHVFDVVIINPHGDLIRQKKTVFLFVAPAFQTFLVWMLTYPQIRWKSFLRKAEQSAAPADMWTAKWNGLTFVAYCKVLSVGICALSVVTLLWGLAKVRYLFGQP